jgi:NADPH:quinone reductase-like Zn-dependent oxidoreductase
MPLMKAMQVSPPKPWPRFRTTCLARRPHHCCAPVSPCTTRSETPVRGQAIWLRSEDKEPLARTLGAHEYIDTRAGAPAEAIQKLGGARAILATAPDARSIAALIDGLAPAGQLVIVGAAPEPLSVSPLQIIMSRRSIQGWPSGTARDSEDTPQFSD